MWCESCRTWATRSQISNLITQNDLGPLSAGVNAANCIFFIRVVHSTSTSATASARHSDSRMPSALTYPPNGISFPSPVFVSYSHINTHKFFQSGRCQFCRLGSCQGHTKSSSK